MEVKGRVHAPSHSAIRKRRKCVWEDCEAGVLMNDCPEQGTETVPEDLHPDADQNERRDANDDVHRFVTERTADPFGESIA